MSEFTTNIAHGQGQTCVAFSPRGTYAFTGGADCIVRIWDLVTGKDREPEVATEADGGVTSVTVSNDYWISGSEDTEVRRYLKDKGQLDGHVTTANGVPIRCVAVDPKGKKVAVASDELSLKVVNLEDILQISILTGHKRGVRKVTWHPSSELLTSCGSDGKIIVWDVTHAEPKVLHTIDGIIPTVIDAEVPEFIYDCSAVWHPSGQHFFVASKTHEVVTISRKDWTKTSSFTDNDITGAVTALAVSINGVYLASAVKNMVYVWSTQTRRVLAKHKGTDGAVITQIAFSPTENLIAWTDSEGVFNRWMNAVPPHLPDPVKPSVATKAPTTVPVRRAATPTLFGNDDIVDSTLNGGLAPDVDMDAPGPGDIDDDWLIDDTGGAMYDDADSGPSKTSDKYVKEMVSITKAQPPFQPGSTPMDNKKRYLAYNMLGVIEVTDQDTHHIVNVDFFDRSARKAFHFTDSYKYDLGYLGERGAVFACQPDSGHPAQVVYRPYGTWTGSKEWTYPLTREGTKVLGVSAGGLPPSKSLRHNTDDDLQGFGNVVVATSEGDLTFLSGTGRERRILGLGGDFVTMVAGSEWVFVVHRAGSTTIDGSQNLLYTLINFDDFSVRQRDVLPIPKGHTLKWVGISSEGAPAIYDSAGRVHVLTKFRIPHHGSWTRILDTNLLERRKGKDESYWPVGITQKKFMCLILKGRQAFPGFPRPLVQELDIIMPFRSEEPAEETIQYELMSIDMAYDMLDEDLTTPELGARENAIDKEFVKLILAATKADNYARALELCKLLHLTSAFDAAIKIADFYHLPGLKEKIGILKAEREREDDRLEKMRDKRSSWVKRDKVPKRFAEESSSQWQRPKPFQDSAPPRAIFRPGLAPAPVAVESTRFTSVAPRPAPVASWDDSQESIRDSSVSPDAKRKRVEDELPSEYDMPPPPPKQKSNPFARKSNQENGVKPNPFARKSSDKSGSVQKSESFFEKVDAVETGKKKIPIKSKAKAKKDQKDAPGIKQASLKELFPGGSSKPKKTKAGAGTKVSDVPESDATLVESAMEETQIDIDAQLAADWDLEETQPADDETQMEETQESPDTQTSDIFSES
ncbi:hypothetical protein HGRIS_002856 [Hohenbuehelia grisea]|uniref:Minichromosome loss protein Mcl1 middle region domain-containing protein n=1 Tax=Hohenbuehelia grisea TaxID=104357 RepID=A0ABR3JMG4_9AGAR